MKTADIKVGEEYAYFAYKHSGAVRVKVAETGAPMKQGYGYGRRTVNSGVQVTLPDKRSITVRPQTIVRPWAEQQVIEDNAAAARKARDDSQRSTAARRASIAKRIDAVLEAHGEPVVSYLPTFWRHEQHSLAALKAVGYETREQDGFRDDGVVTRITGLDDFMSKGVLPEKVTTVLLADAEARA